MKVKIGKPTHWWTTRGVENAWYRLRYKKYDWEVEDEDKDGLDQFIERFLDLWQKTVCRAVNATWGRRPIAKAVIIEPWDIWSADHTSTLDKEGFAAHHERIQNGLRLFGKYYRALWT